MPRLFGFALMIMALALAACGGTPTPTPTPTLVPPTATPEPAGGLGASSSGELFALPTGVLVATPAAAPGTLTFTDTSGTPGAAASAPIVFRDINFFQQGGLLAAPLSITVFSDGRVLRDGAESRITPTQVQQLNDALTALRFFEIEGTFITSGAPADVYRYALNISAPQGRKLIETVDGFTPDELLAFYDLLKTVTSAS